LNRRRQITIEKVSMMQDIPVEDRPDIPKVQNERAANQPIGYGVHEIRMVYDSDKRL
jgi:hypothetical protein